MISDKCINDLFDLLKKGSSLASAARQVGIDYSTALKYKNAGQLPRQLHQREGYTNKRLFDDVWEKSAVPYLRINPVVSAQDLLNHLIENNPRKFKQSQFRTLQRRLAEWRAGAGIILNQYQFTYNGEPGKIIISTFFPAPFPIWVKGKKVRPILFLAYLPFTRWVHLQVKPRMQIRELIEGIEGSLWKLGHVPPFYLHWPALDGFLVEQIEYLPIRIVRAFHTHYNMRSVDPRCAIPAKLNQIKQSVTTEMGKLSRAGMKRTEYATLSEFERDLLVIADILNSKIPNEFLQKELAGFSPLPAKGFNFQKQQKAMYSIMAGKQTRPKQD